MVRSIRIYYTNRRGYWRQNFNWGGGPITEESVVHISISEASFSFPEPGFQSFTLSSLLPIHRWLGDARMTIHNVSPHMGGVEFSYTVDWPDPLNIAVDITVFDPPESVWHDESGQYITP